MEIVSFKGNQIRNHLLSNVDSPILDRESRFIYMAINKVCQQSIARTLLRDRVLVKKDDPRAHKLSLVSISDSGLETIFKFGIVRNPYDRFVSAFSYLKRIGRLERNIGFRQFVRQGDFSDPHFNLQYKNVRADS